MKKHLLLTILGSVIIAIFALQSVSAKQLSKRIRGDKNIVVKEINIKDYNSIYLCNSGNVIYEQKASASPFISLEIDNNLVEYIEIQVDNNNLMIKHKDGASIRPTKYIIRTNSKDLVKATVHGSSMISSAGKINTQNIGLLVKGSGDILINNISANAMSAQVTGSGDITAEGSINVNAIDLSVVGSGDIKAKGLTVENALCEIAGSGDVELNTKQSLDNTIKGSGSIRYVGAPTQINNQINGSGSVKSTR